MKIIFIAVFLPILCVYISRFQVVSQLHMDTIEIFQVLKLLPKVSIGYSWILRWADFCVSFQCLQNQLLIVYGIKVVHCHKGQYLATNHETLLEVAPHPPFPLFPPNNTIGYCSVVCRCGGQTCTYPGSRIRDSSISIYVLISSSICRADGAGCSCSSLCSFVAAPRP